MCEARFVVFRSYRSAVFFVVVWIVWFGHQKPIVGRRWELTIKLISHRQTNTYKFTIRNKLFVKLSKILRYIFADILCYCIIKDILFLFNFFFFFIIMVHQYCFIMNNINIFKGIKYSHSRVSCWIYLSSLQPGVDFNLAILELIALSI